MTISLISGNELGTQDSSRSILDLQQQTGGGSTGAGEHISVNVANGNVIIEHQDAYLPSMGEDFQLVRTYNSQDSHSDAGEFDGAQWTLSSNISVRFVIPGHTIEVTYGDGSSYTFEYDREKGLYVATEGAGAYETIEYLHPRGWHDSVFVLTRADQTQIYFDKHGRMEASVDTNGVRMEYIYRHNRLVQIKDDDGHEINYEYHRGFLQQVTDETGTVLVEYRYRHGLLTEVIDRNGHSTRYFYTHSGQLSRIELPYRQEVDGQVEVYEHRTIEFEYAHVHGRGKPVISRIIDAEGGVTTFEYNSGHGHSRDPFDRRHDNRHSSDPFADHWWDNGGTTRVVDALGNARAYSNEAEYVQWRLENGYYETYKPWNRKQAIEAEMIRRDHAVSFSYLSNGYLSETVDQQGYRTQYEYNRNGDVIAVTNANGWAITHSDAPYYRALRAEMGIVDDAGEGKLACDLTWEEYCTLKEAYTSHYEYDDNGNLLRSEDNNGSVTTFTYTEFNKLASTTSAEGHDLITNTSSEAAEKRVLLGFAADVAELSEADQQALLALFTTTMAYDERQNLIQSTDPGGDLTRFEYDEYGNVSQRIVYLDASNRDDPALQQVTQYFYDAFGNNIETIDAEGAHSFARYDHFGNLVEKIDGNGGVTTYSYDGDNRLLSVTDPEGNATLNTYDAVGNRISTTDANGHTTIRLYDLNNRLVSVVETASSTEREDRVTQYHYDIVGNQTSVTDAEGRVMTYVYNSRNEVLDVITPLVSDAEGNAIQYTTSYQYDGLGNRIRVQDNNGGVTQFVYNQDGLLASRTDAYGQVTQVRYDQNNNQIMVIAGAQLPELRRQILKYVYDEENQQILATDAEGEATRYGYDAVGNRISVTDALGQTTEYEYDHNNRVVREIKPAVVDPVTGVERRYTLEYGYDHNGNAISVTNENGATSRAFFDKNNRQILLEDANGVFTRYTYDAVGQRTGLEIGVDMARTTEGELIIADNVATGQSEYQLASLDSAQVRSYQYDEFGQLIAETDGVGNALQYSDLAIYQQIRESLGFAALVADLSVDDQAALAEAYTRHYQYDLVGNQTAVVDHLDRTTTVQYDALNRAIKTINAESGVQQARFDGNGNQVWQQDAEGRITTAQYDLLDRLVSTTEAVGTDVASTTTRTYDTFGNVLTQTQASGTDDARTVRYEYDLNNRVLAQYNEEGHATHYQYDAIGQRILVTDARQNATQYVYDALGRTVKIIDPLSFATRYEYDGVGNRIAVVDANGNRTDYTFDPGNRQVSATVQMASSDDRTTTYHYNDLGQQVEIRTAVGTDAEQITRFDYDAEGNLRQTIDAEGGVSTQDFDAEYNTVSVTDANGNTTRSYFDALNRTVKVVDALGGESTMTYDAVGNRLTMTDANGNQQSYAYDARNRLIVQRTEADNVETHYLYDAVNNRTAITYAANTKLAVTETFEYYADNQLKAQTDGEGHRTEYVYDANNNQTVVTNAEGHATRYQYDANNRVTHITDPEGGVIEYRYDGNGNRIQVIDAEGHRQSVYYNAANEALYQVDAEGYVTALAYDANGNVLSQTLYAQAIEVPETDTALATWPKVTATEGADRITSFEYDALNRVVAQIDAEGYRRELTYDAVGNQTLSRQYLTRDGARVADSRTWYDALNRATQQVTAEGYLTELQYDALGNITERRVYETPVTLATDGTAPAPVAEDTVRRTQYVYDHNNRVILTTDPLGTQTATVYDARGNRVQQTEAVGTDLARITQFAYDKANRLVQQTEAAGTEVARQTRFAYYADDQLKTQTVAAGTDAEVQIDYVYDKNNRVIETRQPFGDGEVRIERSEYDAAGNRVRVLEAVGRAEARTTEYVYDANNRLIEERLPFQGETTVINQYQYDAAGNQTRAKLAVGTPEVRELSREYDLDNRLIASVDGEQVTTQYQYDGAGNRTAVIADATGTPRTVRYQYDLDNRVVASTSAEGIRAEFAYDVLGNQILSRIQIDAASDTWAETRAYFDALGRQTHSLSPEGYLTENQYDVLGNLTARTLYDTRVAIPADGEVPSADADDTTRVTQYQYDALNRQTREIRSDGLLIDTQYDLRDNRTAVREGVQADGSALRTTHYQYNDANHLVSQTEAVGTAAEVTTQFTVNAFGQTVTRIEAAGTPDAREIRYVYDHQDRLLRQTQVMADDHLIHTDSVYNAHGDLVQSTQAAGSDDARTIVYRYDDNGRMIEQIDADLIVTRYQYDAVGNRTAVTVNPGADDARTQRFEYDQDNRRTAVIDALGVVTRYTLNGLGDVLTETQNATGAYDTAARTIHYQYDAESRLVQQTSAEGTITQYTYDRLGNRTLIRQQVSDSTWAETRAYFDVLGRQTHELSPEGLLTENQYDVFGNVTQSTQYRHAVTVPTDGTPVALPGDIGITVQYQYDALDRQTREIRADGFITDTEYDRRGNRTAVHEGVDLLTGEALRTSTFQYDQANRLTEMTNAVGTDVEVTTRYVLNDLGKATIRYDAVGSADQRETHYVYDGNDRVVRESLKLSTNADGTVQWLTTTTEYNAFGDVIARTAAADSDEARTTRYTYDGNARLVTETNANGETTHYQYDAVGNQTQMTTAYQTDETRTTTQRFDLDNRRIASVDAEGVVTTYVYDGLDQLVTETRAAGTDQAQVTQYAYDLDGRLMQVTSPLGFTTDYTYDRLGNQTTITRQLDDPATMSGTEVRYAVTHQYFDALGRQTGLLSPEGYLTINQYDDLGRLIGKDQYQTAVSADGETTPEPVVDDAVRQTRYVYDARDQLIEETNAVGVTTRYHYDLRGNRTLVQDAVNTDTGVSQRQTAYRYDRADRLLERIDGYQSGLDVTTTYTLNRHGETVHQSVGDGTDARITEFTYDAVGRVTEQRTWSDATLATPDIRTQYHYDAAGNLTLQTTGQWDAEQGAWLDSRQQSYRYDLNDRVTDEINGTGGVTHYAYNALGNRIATTVGYGTDAARTDYFAFDREGRVIRATDGAGGITEYQYDAQGNKIETVQAVGVTGETRVTHYQYDLEGRLMSVIDPEGGQTSYQYDDLGNQVQEINANGGVKRSRFDALGRLLVNVSAGGIKTVNAYDTLGNLIRERQGADDGQGIASEGFYGNAFAETAHGYDIRGNETLTTDPEGFSTRITYNAFNEQTQVETGLYLGEDTAKQARQHVSSTTFSYDDAGRLVSMTDGEGSETRYTYNASGDRLTETVAANGLNSTEPRTTTYEYDLAGRETRITTAGGAVTVHTYDAAGQITTTAVRQSETDGVPLWRTTTFTYTGLGKVATQTDDYGTVTRFGYDAVGNQTDIWTAWGTDEQRHTAMEYDLNNRKTADINALSQRTLYTFDALGNQTSVTDAEGRTAYYYFNLRNELVLMVDGTGAVTEMAYDAAGNVRMTRQYATAIDLTALSQEQRFDRSAAQDLVVEDAAQDRLVASTFDKNGNELSRQEADGQTVEKHYDAANNLLTEIRWDQTGEQSRTQQYQYDQNNRVVRFTDVDGTVTEFAYDGASNKIRQTITVAAGAADTHTTRVTEYHYDLNNRQIREVFDPDGLAIAQGYEYDLAGNKTAYIDGNGNRTTYQYDLNGQVVLEINALGAQTAYRYDRVGNRIEQRDAMGQVYTYEFDAANRVIREHSPEAVITRYDATLGDWVSSVEARVIEHRYDALGNEVQIIDADGYTTTRWFDANGKQTGELNANNVFTAFDYNAFGDQVARHEYLQFLAGSAHNPDTMPSLGASQQVTTRMDYDAAGRLMQTTYAAVDHHTLNTTSPGQPRSVASTSAITEQYQYDAWGNLAIQTDRNGHSTWFYYDSKNRQIAQVDAAGYLTETVYDAQDNILEQYQYSAPVRTEGLTGGRLPEGEQAFEFTQPNGVQIYHLSRRYDAANRMISETTPEVNVYTRSGGDLSTRITTEFRYDANGNQIAKIRGANVSGQQAAEYFYYDAANQMIGAVDAQRTLTEVAYDGNGNAVMRARYNGKVSATDFLSASLSGLCAQVSGGSGHQVIESQYNAFNQLTREVTRIDGGRTFSDTTYDSNDLVTEIGYDGRGNETERRVLETQDLIDFRNAQNRGLSGDRRVAVDNAYVTYNAYDGLNNVVRMQSPDGTGSVFQYDTRNNQILSYTGEVKTYPEMASSIAVSATDTLDISWQGASRAYVVSYPASRADTVSSNGDINWAALEGNGAQKTGVTGSQSASLALGAGDTRFFRVVSIGISGNRSVSEEYQVTMPASLTALSIDQLGDQRVAIARFNSNVDAPAVVLGDQRYAMVAQGDGQYRADLPADLTASQSYRIEWQSAGQSYQSEALTLASPTTHTVTASTYEVTLNTATDGDTFGIAYTPTLPDNLGDYTSLALAWTQILPQGSSEEPVVVTQVIAAEDILEAQVHPENADLAVFPMMIDGLPAGDYQVSLLINTDDGAQTLDQFTETLSASDFAGTPPVTVITANRASLSLGLSGDVEANGYGTRMIVNGVLQPSVRVEDDLITSELPETASYQLYAGIEVGAAHDLTAMHSPVLVDVLDDDGNPVLDDEGNPVQEAQSVNSQIALTLDSLLINDMDANGLQLAWREAGPGTEFSQHMALTPDADGHYQVDLSDLAVDGQYDLKLSYRNQAGQEVLVDWVRIDTAEAEQKWQDRRSLTIESSEENGQITASGDQYSATPGLYSGVISVDQIALSVAHTRVAGSHSGQSQVTGEATGYFTKNEYDVLGNLVATNADTGIWRRFDVDAMGNAIATYEYGTEAAEQAGQTAHVSYTQYDALNREQTAWSVKAAESGSTTATHGQSAKHYNFAGKLIREDLAGGGYITYQYNAVGLLEGTTHHGASGGVVRTETIKYDALGQETGRYQGAGDGIESVYDTYGNQIAQYAVDQHGELADGVIEYRYDALGRRIAQVENSNTTQTNRTVYDNADRIIQQTQGSMSTGYRLDSRGNRVQITHPNNHQIIEIYDELGRVITRIDTQNGKFNIDSLEYDAFGNLIRSRDGNGYVTSKVYGPYQRLLQETDADGRTTDFTYDDFGRQIRETARAKSYGYGITLAAKDIQRDYDDRGQLTAIIDHSTGVSTRYEYDADGHRLREIRTRNGATEADLYYEYNGKGEMVFWHDDQANVAMRYQYDLSGQLVRVFGWDGYASESNKGTQTTHLEYQWRNGKLTAMLDHQSSQHQFYTYYSNGLRKTWDNGTTSRTYTYNANGQVTEATWRQGNADWKATWDYDAKGNVTQYFEYENGSERKRQITTYNSEGTLSLRSESWQAKYDGNESDNRSVTVNSYDVVGNQTKTDIRNYEGKGSKQTSHIWNTITESRGGLKLRETLDGDDTKKSRTKTTTTSFQYDANGKMTSFLKSKDSDGNTETGNFRYNNDGQIVYRTIKPADKDKNTHSRDYFYANGNAVGDKGSDEDGQQATNLGTESYNPVKNLGDEFPSAAISSFTATGGETLRQVAASLMGNANLWFVLAEANGLSGADSLKAGQTITVPNTVDSAKIDADTHKVYNESEIIGSTMPNVRQEAKKKKCASFFMIIIAVVVIAVATVLLPGLGTALAGSVFAGLGATAATVAGYVVAGAVLFAGAEIVRQGAAIALGLQEGFDWSAVGKQAVVGALTGAASGFGAAASLKGASTTIQSIAKVAEPALKASAAAVKSMDENGKITNWSGVALAALGAADTNSLSSSLQFVQENSSYISPWLSMAETAIRNDGKLNPGDWVGAIGSTISAVIDSNVGIGGDGTASYTLDAILSRTALKAVTAGALSSIDEDAAMNYFADAIGSEVSGAATAAIKESDWFNNWTDKNQQRLNNIAEADQYIEKLDNAYGMTSEQKAAIRRRAANGEFEPNYVLQEGLATDENAYGKYQNGVITVDKDLAERAKTDPAAAATLYGVINEERGHQFASALEEMMGIDDLAFDEGALVGAQFVSEAAQLAGNGGFSFSVDFGDGAQNYAFSGVDAVNTLNTQFSMERITADYKNTTTGAEYQIGPNAKLHEILGVSEDELKTQLGEFEELLKGIVAAGDSTIYGELVEEGRDLDSMTRGDMLFGVLSIAAGEMEESEFDEFAKSLGVPGDDVRAVWQILYSGETDAQTLGSLAKDELDYKGGHSGRNERIRYERAAANFASGEMTRREVFDDLIIDPLETREFYDDLGTRLLGGVQAVGGIVEVGVGVGLSETGLGAIIGVPIAVYGMDQYLAGANTVITGKQTQTYLERGLVSAGMSNQDAMLASMVVGLGLGFVGGAMSASSRAGQLSRGLGRSAQIGRSVDALTDGARATGLGRQLINNADEMLSRVRIGDVGKNIEGALTNSKLASFADESQSAVRNALRTLEEGSSGGTAWGRIYQRTQGRGVEWFERMAKGNAVQQIAEEQIRTSAAFRQLADEGYDVIFNRAALSGKTSSKGRALRPDIQILDPDNGVHILDFTTPGQQSKIFKYEAESTRSLMNIIYE